MKFARLFVILVCLAQLGAVSAVAAAPIGLFNGKDLSGWIQMFGGEWTVEDGVLVGRNGTNWTTNPEHSGSWLRTEREYGDFVLELEYAISTNGNSGIHFRSALAKNPSFTGYEMQIVDDYGREPRKSGTGALYDVVAPSRNLSKPAGQWNQVRITCRGNRIQVDLNGEGIVDLQNATRSERGFIGLQNHDTRSVVKFRHLRITELQ